MTQLIEILSLFPFFVTYIYLIDWYVATDMIYPIPIYKDE